MTCGGTWTRPCRTRIMRQRLIYGTRFAKWKTAGIERLYEDRSFIGKPGGMVIIRRRSSSDRHQQPCPARSQPRENAFPRLGKEIRTNSDSRRDQTGG